MDRRETRTDQAPANPAATDEMLSTQPIGYWSGRTHDCVTGLLRDTMARHDVTQPQYWVLNCLHYGSGGATRDEVVAQLLPVADDSHEIGRAIDQLLHRGWLARDGEQIRLTPHGDTARERIRDMAVNVRSIVHDGITDDDYVVAVRVLRRMIANAEGAAG